MCSNSYDFILCVLLNILFNAADSRCIIIFAKTNCFAYLGRHATGVLCLSEAVTLFKCIELYGLGELYRCDQINSVSQVKRVLFGCEGLVLDIVSYGCYARQKY